MNAIIKAIRLFFVRAEVTNTEIEEYSGMYHNIMNQGDISQYLITVNEFKPSIWRE